MGVSQNLIQTVDEVIQIYCRRLQYFHVFVVTGSQRTFKSTFNWVFSKTNYASMWKYLSIFGGRIPSFVMSDGEIKQFNVLTSVDR